MDHCKGKEEIETKHMMLEKNGDDRDETNRKRRKDMKDARKQ